MGRGSEAIAAMADHFGLVVERRKPILLVAVVPGAEVVQFAPGFPFLAGELQRRLIGLHPLLLQPAVGIEHRGVNHGPGIVGDDPGRVDLIRGVVIFGRSYRLILGRHPAAFHSFFWHFSRSGRVNQSGTA